MEHYQLPIIQHNHKLRGLQVLTLKMEALPDSNLLISGSVDRTLRVYDMQTMRCVRHLFGHIDSVTCLHFDHFRLAFGSQDGTLRSWDLDDGKELFEVRNAHQGYVNAVMVGDFRMVTGGQDGVVRLWTFGI